MNNRIRVRCAFLAIFACLSGAASAAPNTPIRSESTAARAVVVAFLQRGQLRTMMLPFNYEPRNLIDRALRSVREVTTLQDLAASPDGVVIDCPESGTLTAKLGRGWPRVVKFEWNACVTVDFAFTNTLTGPGEVTLLGNSLFADAVASIRLGNRTTDLVRDSQLRQPSPTSILSRRVETRNLRLTGLVPLVRFEDDVNTAFRGRFAYEAVGFLRSDEMRRDVGPGGPGTEFFPWTFETSTEGALLSGDNDADDTQSHEENRLVLGTLSQRTDRPATPTFPEPRTSTVWVRGTDYRIVLGRANNLEFWTIDGRIESSYAQSAGCAAPETYTYRTRSPLVSHPETFYFQDLIDSGEIAINGSTVARFSTTGSQPFVDLRGQLALDVPGVGSFNYDTGSSVPGALVLLSRCTP